MNSSLVSIIIPFYQDEKTLKRAISSCLHQTYKNTEIILINDGSEDNSINIAKDFEAGSSKVSLFSQTNLGLSEARNLGIKKSQGEYISFLDSDDELEQNAIEMMVDDIEKSQACVSICKFNLRKENSELIAVSGWKSDKPCISNIEAIKKMYSHKIAYTAWAKLFKASIVKKISFEPGVWFEDRPFFLNYLLQSKLVSFIDEALLSIYTTSNSITRRVISEKRIVDIQKIWEIELNTALTNNLNTEVIRLIYRNHINSLNETMIILSIDKPKEFDKLLKLFNQNVFRTRIIIKENSLILSYKDKLYLDFLKSNRILPWKLFELFFKWKMSHQFASIKIMRQRAD